jgi:hypothetical protein
MKSNLNKRPYINLAMVVMATFGILTACQQQASEEVKTETTNSEVVEVTNKRPAPEFYIIPEEMAKSRVWILENEKTDLFHLKHDCPVLISGKGTGTFKNVTLTRAIDDYGRYNCPECSKELDHIFDEDMIRMSSN